MTPTLAVMPEDVVVLDAEVDVVLLVESRLRPGRAAGGVGGALVPGEEVAAAEDLELEAVLVGDARSRRFAASRPVVATSRLMSRRLPTKPQQDPDGLVDVGGGAAGVGPEVHERAEGLHPRPRAG